MWPACLVQERPLFRVIAEIWGQWKSNPLKGLYNFVMFQLSSKLTSEEWESSQTIFHLNQNRTFSLKRKTWQYVTFTLPRYHVSFHSFRDVLKAWSQRLWEISSSAFSLADCISVRSHVLTFHKVTNMMGREIENTVNWFAKIFSVVIKDDIVFYYSLNFVDFIYQHI